MQYTYEGLLASASDFSTVYTSLYPMSMQADPENIYAENWIFVSEIIPQKLGNLVAALSMQGEFEVPKAKFWQRNKRIGALSFIAMMIKNQLVLPEKLAEQLNSNVKLPQALKELDACDERAKTILKALRDRPMPPLE